MQISRKKTFLLVVLLSLIALFYFFLYPSFSLENLQLQRQRFESFVHENYLLAIAVYISTYIASAALALPTTALFTITGGFLFGTLRGSVYTLFSATVGATLAFLTARYLFRSPLQTHFQKQLGDFNREMNQNGAYYLLSLRLLPAVPFFLLNILAGLTTVSLGVFVVTTLLGTIPGILVFSYAGQQLSTLHSFKDIMSAPLIMALLLLALIALIPVVMRKI